MSPGFRLKQSNRARILIADLLAAVCLALASVAEAASQLGLYFAPATAFNGGLVSGLAAAWNAAAATLGSSNYILLEQYAGGTEYGLFLTVLCVAVFVVAFFAVRSRLLPVLLLFCLPQLTGALLYGLYPQTGILVFYILALLFAAIVMRMDGALLQGGLIAAAIAVICGILFVVTGGDLSTLSSGTDKQERMKNTVGDLLYGRDDLGHGNLAADRRQIREGAALEVTMSEPHSMYLKGYTGDLFNGRFWTQLSDDLYYQKYDMLAHLSEDGFHAPGQLAQAARLAGQTEAGQENRIHVANVGADCRWAFVPYDITEYGTLSEASVKGGTVFYPGWPGKFSEYEYTASENQVERWTDVAAGFFVEALETESAEPQFEEYLRQESHFNVFVYECYTAISKSERKLLYAEIGDPGDQSDGHLNYKIAIDRVRAYLEDHFIYTEDPGEAPSGSGDLLQVFLQSGKGYDIHYATAATLLFRYYGIPARYVEGYLITPDDVRSLQPGQTLSVPRSRAHAWTEIYIDGIGFVPLEVTPEFYGVMPEADMEAGISNEILANEFQERYGQSSGEDSSENQETAFKEQAADIPPVVWILLVIVLCILLILLLLGPFGKVIRKARTERKRKRLFHRAVPKKAVAAIYGYMEETGLHPDQECVQLGNYAAYSPYDVQETDRVFMLKKLEELQERAKKEKKHADDKS